MPKDTVPGSERNGRDNSFSKSMLESAVETQLNVVKLHRGTVKDVVFADNPNKGMQAYRAQNDALYIELALQSELASQIEKLSPEQFDAFYQRCVPEKERGTFTPEKYREEVKQGHIQNIVRGFGGAMTVAKGLESVLGENERRELTDRVKGIVAPLSSDFKKKEKEHLLHPDQAKIEKLKKSIAEDDPEREQKLALLDKANESISFVDPSVADYADAPFRSARSQSEDVKLQGLGGDLEQFNNGHTMQRFLENYEAEVEEGGKTVKKKGGLVDKWPKYSSGNYNSMSTDPKTNPLTDGQIEAFSQERTGISQELKDKTAEIFRLMDEIGEENFRNDMSCQERIDSQGNKTRCFQGEQGVKNYGFWPYVMAKRNLRDAVKEGDLKKIEEKQKELDRIEGLTDRMMEATKGGKYPVFSSNINSTRPGQTDFADRTNELPPKYLLDYVPQNQVNGVFLLYGFCKDNNMPLERVLEDPVSCAKEAAEKFAQAEGVNGRRKTGEKLARLLSSDYGQTFINGINNSRFLLGRGLETVAGMSKSDEERERLIGVSNLAMMAGGKTADPYCREWDMMREASDEQKEALMAQMILTPDEDLDLRKVLNTLQQEDWEKRLDPAATAGALREKDRLDMGAIAERAQTILQDALAEKTALGGDDEIGGFEQGMYLGAAIRACKAVAQTATEKEKDSPGYKNLTESIRRLREQRLCHDLIEQRGGESLTQQAGKLLEQSVATLKQPRSFLFLRLKNSPEHVRMTTELTRLQNKLKLLGGKEVPGLTAEERSALDKMDVGEQLKKAREATYDYLRLKKENGKKAGFATDSGGERAMAAQNTIIALDTLADGLALRSPAEAKLQTLQMEILDNRSDKNWMRENGERCVAEMTRAQIVSMKDWPDGKQKQKLSGEAWANTVKKICGEQLFKDTIKHDGMDKMMDDAMQDGRKLLTGLADEVNRQKQNAKQEETLTRQKTFREAQKEQQTIQRSFTK